MAYVAQMVYAYTAMSEWRERYEDLVAAGFYTTFRLCVNPVKYVCRGCGGTVTFPTDEFALMADLIVTFSVLKQHSMCSPEKVV